MRFARAVLSPCRDGEVEVDKGRGPVHTLRMETALKVVGVLAMAAFGWWMIDGVIKAACPRWGKPPPRWDDDVRPPDFPRPKTEDCTPCPPRGGTGMPGHLPRHKATGRR